jgi:peptide deformylase
VADAHLHEQELDDHAGHDHAGHDHDHDHDHGELSEKAKEAERERIRDAALAQIRQYPDVALRMQAHEVTEFDDYLAQLVERLADQMADAQGVGLAATQLGVLQRVFVFSRDEEGVTAVVNPRILEPSEERESDEEGCLSLQGVRVPVERSVSLTLEGLDPAGKWLRLDLEGLDARVVQHEIDHLDGVLIIDRTDEEHRREALGILRPQIVLR